MADLTDKQELFCKEYLIDLNATQAAIRAGYSEKSASEIGNENLRKPQIQERIQKLQSKRNKRLEITADRVLAEYARIGFASVKSFTNVTSGGDPFIDLSNMDEDEWAAVSEIQVDDYTDGRGEYARDVKKVKVKLHDKLKALDAMAKHVGVGQEQEKEPVSSEDVAAALLAMQQMRQGGKKEDE